MSDQALVGRAREIELIDRAIADLRTGVGTALHLVGEPGIGKTALLDHARSHAGVTVRYATADDTDQRRRLACAQQLIPQVVGDGRHPISVALDALDARPPDDPLVLIADDVQWADGASLEMLGALARRASELGIVVLTAARPRPRPPELGRFETAIDRCGERMELGTLSCESVDELVAGRTGAPADPELAAELAKAGGNPFLTVELLRAFERQRSIEVDAGETRLGRSDGQPNELLARLARDAFAATDDDSLLLRAAAAIPGGFDADELTAIVDRPQIEVLEELVHLVEADILTDRDDRLAFRHDLIREAVVDATPTTVVRSLNRRAIGVLRERSAEPDRIANCWLMAADPADPRDLEGLIDVGATLQSEHPYAARDVLTTARQALVPHDARFVDVTVALGWILIDLGRIDETKALIEELPTGALDRLDVRRLRGETLNLSGELPTSFEPLPDDFDLESVFDVVDDEARSTVAELALIELLAGRVDTARRFCDWLTQNEVTSSPEAEVYLSETRALLCGRVGQYEAGLVAAQRALAVVESNPELQASRVQPTIIVATMLDCLGRGDEALHLMRSHQREAGPRWSVPLLQTGTALAHYRRGEWDDALTEVVAMLTTCDELGVRFATAWPHALFGLIHTARGDLATARSWLERARDEVAPGSIGMEWLMYAVAMLAEADGDQRGALNTLRLVVDTALRAEAPAILLYLSTDAARLADALGDRETLDVVADNLVEIATRTQSPIVEAVERWVSGWRHGDPSGMDRAAEILATCGRAGDRARALHDAAVLHARAGDTADARSRAKQAFASYDEMGAQQLHSRLRSELREHGVSMRPRRAPPRPTSGWESLTLTERQVVGLVGDGLTNSEIAEHLFVSRRTVESHLSRVYPKLDFPTRAELIVAEQHRRRLDPTG